MDSAPYPLDTTLRQLLAAGRLVVRGDRPIVADIDKALSEGTARIFLTDTDGMLAIQLSVDNAGEAVYVGDEQENDE